MQVKDKEKKVSDKELIHKFIEGLRTDIIQDLSDKSISDGDLNMANKSEEESGELVGDAHYYYLVHGRKPGKQPPMDNILSWLEKKGIEPQDISVKSLAFLIARKIGRVGTDIFIRKRPALALDQIIEIGAIAHHAVEVAGDHPAEPVIELVVRGARSVVVKGRLDRAGLGDFCLELHSRKANKRGMLRELRAAMSQPLPVR